MHASKAARRKPGIVVSDLDHERLSALASATESRAPEVASELHEEMARARIVPAEAVPPDVVRMGSSVEYRADDGKHRRVTLVYPKDADIALDRISILTPIGAALIGLSPGQAMEWTARDGRRHALTVVAVEPPSAEIFALCV